MFNTPLTFTRLRFICEAETTLNLGGWRTGSNLRGALLNVMRHAVCAGDPNNPEHVKICPVCWLAASNEKPGVERRGYVIAPPLNAPESFKAGERFSFQITLFGKATHSLPYFVLAVPEAGRIGVGPGRGKFSLKSVDSPLLNGKVLPILKEGENTVYPPEGMEGEAEVLFAAEKVFEGLSSQNPRVILRFRTPIRLIYQKRLLKAPDFSILLANILSRIDYLAMQHAEAARRPQSEREKIWDLANKVRLVEDKTRWADVASGSTRSGKRTWISGLVGEAKYSAAAEVWSALLPWLIWGEVAQVGKNTAKGNGLFEIKR